MDALAPFYLWLRALHAISFISWMAGLLYLPRLFVYHCAAPEGSAQSETFKVMERRLLRAIMNPAMIATWLFGLLLIATPMVDLATSGWLHAKLVLVVLLTALHHIFARWRKDFEVDRNRHSGRFYRLWNEVPTVLMIGIVILAVVKPF